MVTAEAPHKEEFIKHVANIPGAGEYFSAKNGHTYLVEKVLHRLGRDYTSQGHEVVVLVREVESAW